MEPYISSDEAARFQQFGSHTYVHTGGSSNAPERVALGHRVHIHAPYSFTVAHSSPQPAAIVVGDGCQAGPGLQIKARNRVTLGRNVLIAPHVQISDEGASMEAQITIGEGAWIGANAVLQGDVSIGSGSVVKPNSVVVSHVPDYCVVSGSPARIVQIYVPASGEWVAVSDAAQVQDILDARLQHPLLSICIPTFNRAEHLEHCLESIYSQIGNSQLIEVIVSDNASTDATPEITSRYAARFSNMRVVRNRTNIGADPNIFKVMNLARGTFVKLQGDDDFYVEGSILPLLHVLHSHRDCGVIQIFVRNGDGQIWSGSGMNAYLQATSIYATFITSMILRREDLEQIEEPALFLQSSFNQLYLQYAILEKNPRFCIMNSSMFTYAGISSDEYNFGEVIFRSYQSILRHFIGKGLTLEDVRREKKRTLYEYAIPWYRHITATQMIADTTGFDEIYKEHYQEEAYYEEALAVISAITPSTT